MPLKLGLNLVGYVRSEHGIGEVVRLCAQAATAAAVPFAMIDFQAGNHSRQQDRAWEKKLSTKSLHAVNLLCVNADQLPLLYEEKGPDFFAGKYNIGYWFWEAPVFPERWLNRFELVDEVWVASRFVYQAVAACSSRPVHLVPLSVSFTTSPQASRAQFGLPAHRFLFLSACDLRSVPRRKNLEGSLAAFQQAFAQGDETGLVLKLNNAESDPELRDQFRRLAAAHKNLFLLEQTLTRQETYDLFSVVDCLVSLHRAEGFGLVLAEGMFLGKPVIGTAWSGNTDFMTAANSCPISYRLVQLEQDYGPYERGQFWAEPDIDQAAWAMRRLVADTSWRQEIARQGQATVQQKLSPKRVGQIILGRLQQLANLDLPATHRRAA